MPINFEPDVDFQPDAPLSGVKLDPYQLASINPNRAPMDIFGPQTTDLTESLARSIVPDLTGNPNPSMRQIVGDLAVSPIRAGALPFQFVPHQVMDTVENVASDVGNIPFIGLGMNPPFEPGKPILPKIDLPDNESPLRSLFNSPTEIYNQLSEMATPGNVALAGGLHAAGPAVDYAGVKPPSIELAKQIENAPLNIPDTAALAPEGRLGVQVPPSPFFNPGVRDLASRAIEEAQNRAILEPGAEPALSTLRREFNPTVLQQVINATKEEPLGGQVSFNAPAEAEAIPNARQAALPSTEGESNARSQPIAASVPEPEVRARLGEETPLRQQGETAAAQISGEPNAGGGEGNAAKAPDVVNKFSGMDAEQFNQAIRDAGIGVTSMAYRMAEKLSDSDIPALESAQKKANADRKAMVGDKPTMESMQKAVSLGMKGQMFGEAIKWRKALTEARQNNATMTEDLAALERKYGVGESMRHGEDLRRGLLREQQHNLIKPSDLSVPEGGGRPTLTKEWAKSVVPALEEPQIWKSLAERAGKGEFALTDSADKLGFAIRAEGPRALPMLRRAIEIKQDMVKEALKNLESDDLAVQEKAVADINGTQFISEAIEAATRNDKTEKFYANAEHPPIDIPEGDTAFDKIESVKIFKAKQLEANKPLEVEGVTSLDPASGSPLSATDALINKLESLRLKTENGGRLYSLPHPDAIAQIGKTAWNNAIDVAIAAVKAGKEIKDAINEAINYIKKNAQGFNESHARANLESILRNESESVPASNIQQREKLSQNTSGKESAESPRTASLDDVYKIFEPGKENKPGLRERAVNIIEAVRTGVSSKFRPLNRLAEDVARAYGRSSSKDIAGIMEQLKGSRGRGEADVYRFDRSVSDLVKGQEKDFNAYLFLRRSLDRLAQDVATGEGRRRVGDFTPESLQAKLNTLEGKLGPENVAKFREAADNYQKQMDQALRLQVESGRMSPEVYQAIKEGNQFYAPFKVMKYLEESARPAGTGARIDTLADFTKAMKGIEDPNFKLGDMLAAGRQSLLISRILADKNLAMRNVAELAAFDTEGRFIKKLGDKEQPPRGMDVVNILENGKPQKYATNPDVAEALQTYQGAGGDIVTKLLSAVSIPFKAGATALNIPFQVSNLLADVPRQALVSKYGVKGLADLVRYPMDFVHSMYSSMAADVFGSHNKLFQDFLDSGTAGVTIQEHLTPEALRFKEPSTISTSKKLLSTVLNTLPRFAAAIEQTSKVLGIKRAMRIEGAESGAQLAKEIPDAITEIRRFSGSPDFGRQGKWIEQAKLNLIYMFLNARIQGAVADVGRLTGRDGAGMAAKTWFKLGTAVGIPTAYLWALNNRDEYKDDFDKRPQQEKQNYWLIPKDTYITNDDGEKMRDYWRVPKRESSKWIANLTESALNFAQKKDAKAATDWASMMLNDISPVNIQGNTAQERLESVGGSLNPMIKAPLETATGRDMYRHRDLIPENQRKASPELQFTDKTPEIFKKLANAMPDVAPEFLRSPIVLDNLTRNLTAGLITQFLPRKPVEGRTGIENTPLLQRFQALPYTDQQAFKDEMQVLEREGADEMLTRHRAITKLLDDNKGQPLAQIVAKAPMDKKFIRSLVDVWVAKQNGANAQDRQLLTLPPKERAAYIADKLKDVPADKRGPMILDFARKRVLTEDVAAELANQMK